MTKNIWKLSGKSVDYQYLSTSLKCVSNDYKKIVTKSFNEIQKMENNIFNKNEVKQITIFIFRRSGKFFVF